MTDGTCAAARSQRADISTALRRRLRAIERRETADLTAFSVAVLLNTNAKRVSRRVQKALRHGVPENELFLSRTAEEARHIAREVVDRGYRTVFTGGGDGTFVSFVTEILGFLRERPMPAPRFGVL